MDHISFKLSWKRPSTVPYPMIWHTFENKSGNGDVQKFLIQDLTADKFDVVIDYMKLYYFRDEPLCKYSKLLEDEVAVHAYQSILYKVLENMMSIVVLVDDDSPNPKIAGMEILCVNTKEDPVLLELPGVATKKIEKILNDLNKGFDIFQVLESDKYLEEWGMCVLPEFRGREIGYNMLLCHEKMCKAFGIAGKKGTSPCIQTQKLISRVGYKLYAEIVYNDYKDENGEVIFPVEDTKSIKLMVIKYNSATAPVYTSAKL